jgi:hypothetical protein
MRTEGASLRNRLIAAVENSAAQQWSVSFPQVRKQLILAWRTPTKKPGLLQTRYIPTLFRSDMASFSQQPSITQLTLRQRWSQVGQRIS